LKDTKSRKVIDIVELLAPARDFLALSAAINNGADAVYVGLAGYNMRAHSGGFSLDELKKAVGCCHESGVKLYLCTNTIMRDKDLEDLREIMPEISSLGVDALIASDLGVLNLARGEDLDVHLSVQANISNLESLKLLNELGVKRVILSRELSLSEIKEIIKKSPLEVEVFVHGAMCLAISGRCFLSAQLYQKSANCGECLQPCRREWKLTSDDSELIIGENFSRNSKNASNNFSGHLLSPRDLCMVDHIPELIDAGIASFKIEGRARPAEYVATVTRVYREAIDCYHRGHWKFDERWMQDLKRVFNRGFDTGFYYSIPHQTSSSNQATHLKKDVGEVTNYYQKAQAAEIRLWNSLQVGDGVIIQGPTTGSVVQKAGSLQIHGKNIQKAVKGDRIGLMVKNRVRPGDIIYKLCEKS
jgi:U32 family peptidase